MRDVDNEIGRLKLIVVDKYPTTSFFNFFSVGNGISNEILLGDGLSLDFNNLVQAMGLFIVGTLGPMFKIDSIVEYCLINHSIDLIIARKEHVQGTLDV